MQTRLASTVVVLLNLLGGGPASVTLAQSNPAEMPSRLALSAGLDPESFAGATAPQALAAAVREIGADTEVRATFVSTETALAGARLRLQVAETSVRSEGMERETLAELDSLRATLVQAVQDHAQAAAAVRSIAVRKVESSLGPSRAARLARLSANHAWSVPPEYRVLQLSDEEWRTLESAVAVARDPGATLSSEQAAAIAAAETDPEVTQVRAALTANLDAARSAMNSIVIAEMQAITQQ